MTRGMTRSNILLALALGGCVMLGALVEGFGRSMFGIRALEEEITQQYTASDVAAFRKVRKQLEFEAAQMRSGLHDYREQVTFSPHRYPISSDRDPKQALDAYIKRIQSRTAGWGKASGRVLEADFVALAGPNPTPANLSKKIARLMMAERAIQLAMTAGMDRVRLLPRPEHLTSNEIALSLVGTERSVRLFLTALAERGNLLAVRKLEITVDQHLDRLRIESLILGKIPSLYFPERGHR